MKMFTIRLKEPESKSLSGEESKQKNKTMIKLCFLMLAIHNIDFLCMAGMLKKIIQQQRRKHVLVIGKLLNISPNRIGRCFLLLAEGVLLVRQAVPSLAESYSGSYDWLIDRVSMVGIFSLLFSLVGW